MYAASHVLEDPLGRYAGFAARLLAAPVAIVYADGHATGVAAASPRVRGTLDRAHDAVVRLCQTVSRANGLVIVEDARIDLDIPERELVLALGGALLGRPLPGSDGAPAGCVIVVDDAPRRWLASDIGALMEVARAADGVHRAGGAHARARAGARARELATRGDARGHRRRHPGDRSR
jgi:hypothetical protein